MKKFAKSVVASILGWQIRRLRRKNNFKVIAIAGSIGKTSTKFAIAKVLKQKYRVKFQEGNYNDLVTVPLIFFGHQTPSILNPLAWVKIFISNEQQIKRAYPYDVVVVEVGTDGPGQIKQFARYLRVDIGVVTAISPEHMEFFDDLDAVAKEELSLSAYVDQLVINMDLCQDKYLKTISTDLTTYGTEDANYKISNYKFGRETAEFDVIASDKKWNLKADAVSMSELYSAAAALTVGDKLELSDNQLKSGVRELKPVSGRMQRLKGIKNSLILDETYNASPTAVMSALDSLYMIDGKQKIALLGNMNELGKFSESAHREIGEYCDAKQLDLVITLGKDSNKFLAPAAEAQGCKVESFDNPYDAGEYIKEHIKEGAVVLAKGSQNGVFAEESVKLILSDPKDEHKLVRQSREWLKTKEKSFGRG